MDPWFEKGQRWLVYAADERLYQNMNMTGPYVTKLMSRACSRTTMLKDAAEDLKELGESKPPIATSNSLKMRF
jgi:hypothetical protein